MADVGAFGMLGAMNPDAMVESASAKFMDIPLDRIREDGENPRETFDPETMEELAATIKARGVITPISVRPDPERPDGYIVNHGHRRLRASSMAGRLTIPAVIDETFRDEDRIIENIQRDNLGMYEVAAYIGRKVAQGMKQKDIAALIGKSNAYVSNHAQLLELPPLTASVVEQGAVNDVTTINDLIKLEKRDSAALGRFLDGCDEVTRSAVKAFRAELDAPKPKELVAKTAETPVQKAKHKPAALPNPIDAKSPATSEEVKESTGASAKTRNTDLVFDEAWRLGRVIVEQDGKRGMLRLDYRPQNEDYAWVEWEDGVEAMSEEPVESLKIRAVVQS